ncbi:P-loop containing nucleoside triphosphate hydrolase protein [Aspergillus spinulosporus]
MSQGIASSNKAEDPSGEDTKGSNGETVEISETSPKSKEDASTGHAFILKKVRSGTSPNLEEGFSEIDIISLDLWDLLREHLGGHPYHIYGSTPITLYSPWDAIILEWETLQKAASQDPVDEKDKIQFDDLWTIFPPGTLVYGKPFQNQHQVFIVEDYVDNWPYQERTLQKKVQPWKLQCWTYDWNGDSFQRTSFILPFESFEGHRPITALPYYPFDYVENKEEIQKELIDRGNLFRKYCTAREGSQLFNYAGNAIFSQKGFSGLMQDTAEDSDNRSLSMSFTGYRDLQPRIAPPEKIRSSRVDSQVMVDYASYFQYGVSTARNGVLEASTNIYECTCLDCRENKSLTRRYRTHFDSIDVQKRKDWEDEQYMLCPPRVLGYILRAKQWAQLQVTSLKDIQMSTTDNSWQNRLQLADDNNKKILFDLIQSHVSSTANSETDNLQVNDIIPEKGKGLVILLYGPPGVGKTSTAETIAIVARKPLFSISVADVGTKPQRVEANLARIFALATSWQAILLIDEADVFLESRGRGQAASTEKNALVSVFLRVLEYYQGIMFLTTNQIAQFDIAIPSRIHVALRYETLNKDQMKKIFMGFLDPLETKGLINDYDDIQDWLAEDVYKLGFDGRQIRNIVTTALGLARADRNDPRSSGKLHKKHLKLAVNNVHAFKNDFLVQMDRYINSQEKMIK